jgi:hypothetical protein
MRFIVGDLVLNLVAMVKKLSGMIQASSVADKEKGGSGWVSQEEKRGSESVRNGHLEWE